MAGLIPQAKKPEPKYPVISLLIRISIGFLVLAAILSVGMFGWSGLVRKEFADLAEQSKNMLSEERKNFLSEAENLAQDIEFAKKLVRAKGKANSPLKIIEGVVRPNVVANRIMADVAQKKIDVEMEAENITAFWEQIRTLRSHPEVKAVEISDFSIGEVEGVAFKVGVVFDFTPASLLWVRK